jgi:hypothetical protein
MTSTTATYNFGLLVPSRVEGAEAVNSRLLGPLTLGIEVTESELAARCGLGNIDPQHSGKRRQFAAIEACFEVAPPATGSTLVTIRPDADAFGAMALLAIRARGQAVDDRIAARVDRVARWDRFAHGPWPGRRSLPSSAAGILALQSCEAERATLAAAMADNDRSVADRVMIAERWLLADQEPWMEASQRDLKPYEDRVRESASRLAKAVEEERIRFHVAANGRIAVVGGLAEASLRLAYCLAPVVIAVNPAFRFQFGQPHLKYTICQYIESYVDLAETVRRLAALEPGWGGSRTIIGSPQGVGSCLMLDHVVKLVEAHLLPGSLGQ